MKLLPCPFCGDPEPYFERKGNHRQSCQVACSNCGCFHESADEDEKSGKSWNQRATDNRVPAGYILRTGHGTKIVEIKPDCEIDYWIPLYE